MTAWTDHVKKWAKAHGKSYGCAMSDPACKKAYKGEPEPAMEKKTKAPRMTEKEPKPSRNPLRGKVTRQKYSRAEDARDAMAAFKKMKAERGRPVVDFGISPGQIMSIGPLGFGISADRAIDMEKRYLFNM
jgi:hypothetical protein